MSKIIPVALALAAALAAGAAQAQSPAASGPEVQLTDAAELQALDAAKVGLGQAIAAAEKEAGGKAIDAGFEAVAGRQGFAVEVMAADGSQTLFVDAETGAVSKVAAGEENRHGQGGAEDEGDGDGGEDGETDD